MPCPIKLCFIHVVPRSDEDHVFCTLSISCVYRLDLTCKPC